MIFYKKYRSVVLDNYISILFTIINSWVHNFQGALANWNIF